MIPLVGKGQKIRVTAQTLNEIATHINGVPAIGSGKPMSGGGGASVPVPIVTDNNIGDLFLIYKYSDTAVRVKAGVLYLGTTEIISSESSNIVANTSKKYIYVEVRYSNNTFTTNITWSSSIQTPDSYNRYNSFRYTIGCVYLVDGVIKIEQWHTPAPIIIYNRWIG